ncbi:MAG: deoxyribose-phosphate aldolase [Candidatus Latescibacterota bacterium]|nr:MAG: deoxyribose-phosphate aldolase [Candidatus Latescibacterota bacterium]
MLKPGCTLDDVTRVCEETAAHKFAAVVVPPCFVADAVAAMAGTRIPVCSVVSFPFGWDPPADKRDQATRLLNKGATEIDMVMNVSAFLSGFNELVEDEIVVVRECCSADAVLKVIIETAYLDDAQIAAAARICVKAGAHYVKTSTGFAPRGATVEDIALIKRTIGDGAGIKAAGGIRTCKQALALVGAGATRLGCSASVGLIENA